MTLRQARLFREIARTLSISAAADALNTSQPGVSRHIQQLEAELGVELLVRRRNKVVGLTDAGRTVLEMTHRLVAEADNIAAFAADQTGANAKLTIATSHLHARYTLAEPVAAFARSNRTVQLHMRQVAADEISTLVESGESDIGVSTETSLEHRSLFYLPLAELRRSLITPLGHPLARKRKITIEDIAGFPIVGYSARSRTGEIMARAFSDAAVVPKIVVSATDSDVIKGYVAAGLGIGIVPSIAVAKPAGEMLTARDVTGLFPATRTVISLRRDTYLRSHAMLFISRVAPEWDRTAIARAIASKS